MITLEQAKARDEDAVAFMREHAERLVALLKEPQGCLTWSLMVGEHMQALSDFWNQKRPAM